MIKLMLQILFPEGLNEGTWGRQLSAFNEILKGNPHIQKMASTGYLTRFTTKLIP